MSRTYTVPLQQHDVNSFRVSQRAREVTCHLITVQTPNYAAGVIII